MEVALNFLDKIYEAGVVGAGGAGFPTHIKLNTKVGTLIINAAECEPLLQTDKYLMRTKPEIIIRTVEETGKQVEAHDLIIALKGKNKEEVRILQEAIDTLKSPVRLHQMPNFYPAGDEMSMVKEVTGKSIPPAGIPSAVDAVVVNVNTICNIADALEDKPIFMKEVAVLGEVKNPILLNVPVGISLAECIQAAGGPLLEDYFVIKGGPMMGSFLEKSVIHNTSISKTDGAIILLPKDSYLLKMKKLSIEHMINRAKSACIQCKFCTIMCPRYLLGHPLHPHLIMRNVGKKDLSDPLFADAHICCECGICELFACPMGLSPREMNVYVKKERAAMGLRFEHDGSEVTSRPEGEYRKISADRIIARIGLSKYKYVPVADCINLSASKVKLMLRQHIGQPASPIVKNGDHIKAGQVIARVAADKMGANIHASINGIVSILDDAIVIEQK